MKRRTLFQAILVMVLLLLLAASLTQAQESDSDTFQPHAVESALGPNFTYQGQLVYDGAPVNDSCDFTFSLWDGTGVGSIQIGTDESMSGLVVSDGLFTMSLNFGAEAFNGDARWLEIEVNCGEGVITLSPRQQLTPAPYAHYAVDADLLDGQHASAFADTVHNHDSSYWSLSGNAGTTPGTNFLGTTDAQPLALRTNNTEGMRLDTDGNLGIGTTSPGERLTVAGKVESTSGGFKFPDGTTQTTAAGGGDVKQLIQDFVVASGESVTAGEVVQFLDGYVMQDSVYGSGYTFNNDDTEYLSVAALSSTKFVVVYADYNLGYGRAVIGDVSGATISYGSEYVFNNDFTTAISVAALSSTKFVVVYRDEGNSYYGTAVIGNVTGDTISHGSEYVFNYDDTWPSSVAALSDAKFVVAYIDVGSSNYGAAVIGDVSSTVIGFGSEYVFNSDATSYISTAALSSTKFVVAYRDEGNSYYGTAVIGDVSGTNITYDPESVFNSDATEYISTAALRGYEFVVAYRDAGNSDYATAVIGEASGFWLEYGSKYVFSSASTGSISVATLSDTQFVVAYQDYGGSGRGTAVIGDVSGTVINFGPKYVFGGDYDDVRSVAALSPTHFMVAYMFDGEEGVAKIIRPGHSVGIAGESRTQGQSVPVIIGGVSDVHSYLIPGEVYYSDKAGGLTTSRTDWGIGLAVSDTELLLDIDLYAR